jgi:hypothetical protein
MFLRGANALFPEAVDPKYGMMTFTQYMALRQAELDEGLWLADKNAVPGMSRINPFPVTQARLKQTGPKPIKPLKPFTPPKFVRGVPSKPTRTSVDSKLK